MSLKATMTTTVITSSVLVGATVAVLTLGPGQGMDLLSAWSLHQIVVGASGTGQPDGADGVFIGTLEVSGTPTTVVATGHEQGLRLTASIFPGLTDVESPWPTLTLPNGANLCSAEDVVLGDVDSTNDNDIVAACETGTVRVSVFFSAALPNTLNELVDPANWTQVDIAASAGNRSMRAAVVNIDGVAGNEIVVGGKESSGPCVAAQIGYYSSATPTVAASWAAATFTTLNAVGWVMNMYVQDLDGDTDIDVVYSDREPIDCPTPGGGNQGITVIKATSPGVFAAPVIYLGGEGDHKWFTLDDWDSDGDLDIVDCRSNGSINTSQVLLNGGSFNSFPTTISIPQPTGVGQCQHVVMCDVDGDGDRDPVFSYSNAQNASAAVWLRRSGTDLAPTFERGEITGILDADSDVKADNLDCRDIDGDGDVDLYWTEQHVAAGTGPGLGVVYNESPRLTFVAPAGPANVSCTLLTAGSSTTDGTSFNTASVAPAADQPIYVVVQSAAGAGPTVPTTTGNGITYTEERSATFGTRRLTVLRGAAASPSAGAINYAFGASQTSVIWQVIQCAGADTSGTNGSGATPQSASNTVAAGTSVTATLPGALNDATSMLMCAVGLDIASTVGPDADLLEFSDANVAAGASTLEGQKALDQTACTGTHSSANGAAMVWEVRAP